MRIGGLLAVGALGISGLPTAFAWGAAGHEIVATIAQIHLHPSVLPTICTILNYTSPNPNVPLCHLAPIATWADKVRFRMRWSAGLHYIGALGDHPSDTCIFPGNRGWAGRTNLNVLGGIRNVTGILEDWVVGEGGGLGDGRPYDDEVDGAANEALKFLVHFLGDMHMPLHLTGRDRGGNGDKVSFDGRVTNLHSLWDSLLIAKSLRTVPANYSHPLPSPQIEHALRGTIYDSYVRRVMWEGVLGKWKDDIPKWLTCPHSVSGQGLFQQVMSLIEHLGSSGGGEEWDNEVLCPYSWATPIHQLNCDIVWPKALDLPPYNTHSLSASSSSHSHSLTPEDEVASFSSSGEFVGGLEEDVRGEYLELDTPEYAGAISEMWVVEKLMAMAGIRLAGVLNWLFAEVDRGGLNISEVGVW